MKTGSVIISALVAVHLGAADVQEGTDACQASSPDGVCSPSGSAMIQQKKSSSAQSSSPKHHSFFHSLRQRKHRRNAQHKRVKIDQKFDSSYVAVHMPQWNTFLDRFDFQGKKVLDYGMDDGYLAQILFKDHNLGAYSGVAVTLSEAMLDAPTARLQNWHDKVDLHVAGAGKDDLAAFQPDIIISQKCIENFPTQQTLDEFLNKVDTSNAKQLMLQFRRSSAQQDAKMVSLIGNVKLTGGNVADENMLASKLPHYKMIWKNETKEADITNVYTGWEATGTDATVPNTVA